MGYDMISQDTKSQIELYLLDGLEGKDWYVESTEDIREIARATQLDSDFIADVVAILSPRVSVDRNIKLAVEWIFNGLTEGVMTQRIDALEDYLRDGVVRGAKVSCFAENLKGNYNEITVDVWIAEHAFGFDFAKLKASEREAIKEVIADLAEYYDMTPAAAQACIWVGCRKAYGHNNAQGALLVSDYLCK